jgi:hypothetical protein
MAGDPEAVAAAKAHRSQSELWTAGRLCIPRGLISS